MVEARGDQTGENNPNWKGGKKKCFNYRNLQPLWKLDNRKKWAK